MNNVKMLYYDRIHISEGIDVNKTSASKDCVICHYWYFLYKEDIGCYFHHMSAIGVMM